jgi:hypothetical protein
MLHTNRESYRLKSLQQKLENWAQNDTPLTLKEETLKSIQDRKALEETQKAEVDKFLKSISFSNGSIRSTISQEQKTVLDSMLATLDIQKKENEILDTNVIRQKLGIQQETRQALAVERNSWNPDKKLAKGMAESVNPELAELKLFLIKNGYLDAKYTNTQIKYGNETVTAIKKYNEANPENSLWNNPEEVSVKRVRELKDVQVIKSTPVAQPKAPEQKETPSAIVAKRVHKWADGKLPDISDAEKKATKNLQVALTTLWLYVGKDDGIFGQATEDAVKKFLASPDLRGNISANTNPQEVTQVLINRIEEAATKAQRIAAAPQDPVSIVKPQRRPSQKVSDRRTNVVPTSVPKWIDAQIKASELSVDQLTRMLLETSDIYKALEEEAGLRNQGYSIFGILQRLVGNKKASDILARQQQFASKMGHNVRRLDNGEYAFEPNQEMRAKFNRGFERLAWPSSQEAGFNSSTLFKVLPWAFGIYVADIPLPFIRKMVPSWVPMTKAFAFIEWCRAGMPGEFNPDAKVKTGLDAYANLRTLRQALANNPRAINAIRAGKIDQLDGKVKKLVQVYFEYRLLPDLEVLDSATSNIFQKIFGSEATPLIKQLKESSRSGNFDFQTAFKVLFILDKNDRSGWLFGIWAGENQDLIQATQQRTEYMEAVDLEMLRIKALRGDKEAQRALKAIETQKVTIDVNTKAQPLRLRRNVYGLPLDKNWTGQQVANALRNTRPAESRVDSLSLILANMRGLDGRPFANSVTVEELYNCMCTTWKFIPINQLWMDLNTNIQNTGRNGQVINTSFRQLMTGRWDTHVFVVNVKGHTLYLRPDCSNFMMVPPKWNDNVGLWVSANLPLVIPYNVVFPGKPPVGWRIGSQPWDNPTVINPNVPWTTWTVTWPVTWGTFVPGNPLAL